MPSCREPVNATVPLCAILHLFPAVQKSGKVSRTPTAFPRFYPASVNVRGVVSQGTHSSSAKAAGADKTSGARNVIGRAAERERHPAPARIPASAMNTAFEYALPRHLALFGPSPRETDEQRLFEGPPQPSSLDRGLRSILHGSWGRPPSATTPATELHAAGGGAGCSSSGRHCADLSGRFSAPLNLSARGEHATQSLQVRTEEAGGTIVLSPFRTESTDIIQSTTSVDAAFLRSQSSAHSMRSVPSSHFSRGGAHMLRRRDSAVAHADDGVGPAAAPQEERGERVHRGVVLGTFAEAEGGAANEAAVISDTSEAAGVAATYERRLRRLHRQLDSFGEDDVFLGRYEMMGRQHRRRGGAACTETSTTPNSPHSHARRPLALQDKLHSASVGSHPCYSFLILVVQVLCCLGGVHRPRSL